VHARFFPYLHVLAAGCVVALFAPGFLPDIPFPFFAFGGPALALSLALSAPALRRAPLRCAGFVFCSIALYEAAVYATLRAERDAESLALATALISGLSSTSRLALYSAWLGNRKRIWRAPAGLPLGALASLLLHAAARQDGSPAYGTVGFVLAWDAGIALAIGTLGL